MIEKNKRKIASSLLLLSFFSPNHTDRRCNNVRNRERAVSRRTRCASVLIEHHIQGKEKKREKQKEKDRFFLPFSNHFAFLHLLSSRNMLGVAAVVRRKNTDNNQMHDLCCCCCRYYIVKTREEKKRRRTRTTVHILSTQ